MRSTLLVEGPLKIAFGKGLGNITLGSTLNDIVASIHNESNSPSMDVIFPQPSDAFKDETMITFPELGVRLRFRPISQQLYIIDLYDLTKRAIVINGNTFDVASDQIPSFEAIHRVIGTSFPGRFLQDDLYFLRYDGLALLFSSSPESSRWSESIRSNGSNDHEPLLPDESSLLSRVFIHPYDLDLEHPWSYKDPVNFKMRVHIRPIPKEEHGTSFTKYDVSVYPIQNSSFKATSATPLKIGMSPQDVVSILGTPEVAAVSHNSMSAPSIPSTNTPAGGKGGGQSTFSHYLLSQQGLYRYEYQRLGLELFFGQMSHRLIRMVLHNNLPGQCEFGRFHRCPFHLVCGDIQGWSRSTGSLSSGHSQPVPVPQPHVVDKMQLRREVSVETLKLADSLTGSGNGFNGFSSSSSASSLNDHPRMDSSVSVGAVATDPGEREKGGGGRIGRPKGRRKGEGVPEAVRKDHSGWSMAAAAGAAEADGDDMVKTVSLSATESGVRTDFPHRGGLGGGVTGYGREGVTAGDASRPPSLFPSPLTTACTGSGVVSTEGEAWELLTSPSLPSPMPQGVAELDNTTPWSIARATLSDWAAAVHCSTSSLSPSPPPPLPAAIRAQPPGSPFPNTRLYGFPELSLIADVSEGGFISSLSFLESWSS